MGHQNPAKTHTFDQTGNQADAGPFAPDQLPPKVARLYKEDGTDLLTDGKPTFVRFTWEQDAESGKNFVQSATLAPDFNMPGVQYCKAEAASGGLATSLFNG